MGCGGTSPWGRKILVFLAIAMPLAACGANRDVDSSTRASGRSPIRAVLSHVDTLSESESLFVGRVQGALVDNLGTIVTDQAGRRAVFWPADGKEPTAIGRPGSGPGEFLAPIDIVRWRGDTVAITDVQQKSVSVFSQNGARFVARRAVGGIPLRAAIIGGTLVVGSVSASGRTGLVSILMRDTTVRRAVELPESVTRNPLALRILPIAIVGTFGDSIIVGFQTTNELLVVDADLRIVAALDVPVLRRRMIPADLDAALKPVLASPERLTLIPDLEGLFPDGHERVVVVHREWTSPPGGIQDISRALTEATLKVFASVIDVPRGRACVDIEIPSDWAENPAITMSPRGLAAVGHRVSERGRPVLEVRTFDLPLHDCDWQPIVVRATMGTRSRPPAR